MTNGRLTEFLGKALDTIAVADRALAACETRSDRIALIDLTLGDPFLFESPDRWRPGGANWVERLQLLSALARQIEYGHPIEFWITGSFTRIGPAAPDIDILIRRRPGERAFRLRDLEHTLLLFTLIANSALRLRCDVFFRLGHLVECLKAFDVIETWGSDRRIAWVTVERPYQKVFFGSPHSYRQIGRFLVTHKVRLCDTDFFAKQKRRVRQTNDKAMPDAIRLSEQDWNEHVLLHPV